MKERILLLLSEIEDLNRRQAGKDLWARDTQVFKEFLRGLIGD